MQGTGSIRTATRWRSSSALVLLLALLLGGCVTSTTTFYVPTAGQPRLSEREVRARGEALVGVACPRLLQTKNPAAGAAAMTIDLGGDGAVARAAIDRSSGDVQLDDLFGALVAQLQLPADSSARHGQTTRRKATVGFSCAPTAPALTLEIASARR